MLSVERVDLFYGASQALRGVSLTAPKNAVTCVMGRNGVGKTSLMRAIVGQQPIRSGRILWEDEDITRLAPYERSARGVAFVPQGREIFPLLTVEENLQTGFAALPRALRRVQDEIFELFPVLKDMLQRRGGDLSGGQQQQLAIARALVTRPRLLVLDEPTEGIQPSIIKDIERVIRLLLARGNLAILLVEQYFEFARDLADSYAVMDRGEIVVAGKGSEMVEADVRRHLTV
jgi:urea transport system ATP-binding protein